MKGISLPKPTKSGLLRAIGTIISLVLVIVLLVQQGWNEIVRAIQQIPAWIFLVSLALMVISRLMVTARWHILLRAASFQINYGQALRITFAGLFATNFLPTTIGGDVIRLAGMLRKNYDAAITTASLIIDRLVGMIGMAMVIPVVLPNLRDAGGIRRLFPSTNEYKTIYTAALLPSWIQKIWERGRQIIHKLLASFTIWLKKPFSLIGSLGFSWMHMLCLFGIFYLLLSGMGEKVSYWEIGGLYSLVYFFTLLPISINGYGLQELSITVVLSSLTDVSIGSALSMALLFRTLMMIASLPGALFLTDVMASKQAHMISEPQEQGD